MDSSLGLGRALAAPKSLLSILALVLAILYFIPVNGLIQSLYPDRPPVPDLFFTLVPEQVWLSYVSDPLILLSILLMLHQGLNLDRRRLPYYFAVVAAGTFARENLILLTPLGRPTGNLSSFGIFSFAHVLQHGMFPSGHQMLATLAWFLIDRRSHPRLKRLAGFLMVLQALVLLASRGHYSIDIAGGWMLAYVTFHATRRWRRRLDLLAPPPARRAKTERRG